eukprot:277748-Karenia_brevis.AAC.1
MAVALKNDGNIQIMPTRVKALKDTLSVTKPTARDMLRSMDHTIDTQEGKLMCQHCGQIWTAREHTVESEACLGPAIRGIPQVNRSWMVPPGRDIQWGSNRVFNTRPTGHKLQWYK